MGAYSVNVAAAGDYVITATVASPNDHRQDARQHRLGRHRRLSTCR